MLIAVDPLTLLDVSQDEAKEAKEDSDDGKAESEKADSEARCWHILVQDVSILLSVFSIQSPPGFCIRLALGLGACEHSSSALPVTA